MGMEIAAVVDEVFGVLAGESGDKLLHGVPLMLMFIIHSTIYMQLCTLCTLL